VQTPTPQEVVQTIEIVPSPNVVVASSGPSSGQIKIVELSNNIALPADVGRVEFKWVYQGPDCAPLPDGQGFEIRIWPEQPGYIPLGVADAANQDDILCDPENGTRTYEIGYLRNAPGVALVNGGRFRWEVALVQLDPYKLLDVSEPRVFELPPSGPTPTPAPTPRRVVFPADENPGVITLLEPIYDTVLPADAERLQFQWRWSLSQGCALPPAGYGFELRIWQEGPDNAPLGAMGNAAENQAAITCDPNNGQFSYWVPNITRTPAVVRVRSGRFLWDVNLVQLDPYAIRLSSLTNIFEIPPE
jgi:hypothetical protein